MLSASHNPMPDNGIKFFARGGTKLDDALEDAIEGRLGERWARPTGAAVGRVRDDPALGESYIAHLVGSLERPVSLDGITVVVDCANGAAFQTGPAAFESQGAKVIRIHAEPDGTNINLNAGSTHMDALRSAVLDHGADLGIALDGDADRCLAVDATGRTVDGDQILAILAGALKESGQLTNDTVVATVMSNLGFFRAMEADGDHGRADQGGRPVRARGHARQRVLPRWRAVGPRRAVEVRDHRRRRADRSAPDEPDGRDRPVAWRIWRR